MIGSLRPACRYRCFAEPSRLPFLSLTRRIVVDLWDQFDITTTVGEVTESSSPATLRPAATLLLVRDGAEGLEVLMVKRSERSSFMGGVYVFPGGVVDAADSSPALLERCTGRSEAEARAQLGVPEDALCYWVAAIRELFEESGVLLARHRDGSPLGLSDGDNSARQSARLALNSGELSFADWIEREDLILDLGALHYNAHWITPTTAGKRFDTYFFVARAPDDQIAVHDDGETVAVVWTTPEDAFARHRAGEIDMVLPTLRNLQFIAGAGTAAELCDRASALTAIPSILPRMVESPEGPVLLVPGDVGYEDLPGAPDDPRRFPEAARRRALWENPPT